MSSRTICHGLFALAIAITLAASASAQQYGQWTWDGRIGARERSYEFAESKQVVDELQEREGVLSLGLNGYVVHPAIAAFRLGIDTNVTQREGTARVGSRKLGYRGDLRVFPTGAYPVHLYASRQAYRYDNESPATPIGSIPDVIAIFGARVRVRSGPLTGLVARAERSRIGLLGPRGGVESHQYQLADWAGGGKDWRHHYRLERQVRGFAASRYSTDDVALLADESYRAARWQWTSSTQLNRRGWSSESYGSSGVIAARVQNRLLSTSSPTRSWELQHSSGITLAEDTSQSHTLGARYSFATRRHLTIAPFANVGFQMSDALRVFAPQAGLSATWTGEKGPVNAVVSGSAASAVLQTDGRELSTRDATVIAIAGASLSLRPSRGLHSQLEAHVSRNELRRSGETITDSSILVPLGGIGTEDRTQARLTLGRRWKPAGVHFLFDWIAQSTSGDLQVNPYTAETLSSSLQLTLRNFNVSISTGNATLEQNRVQELHFVTAAARLQLVRSMSLTVSQRQERRMVIGEPDAEGERSEAGLSVRLGSYTIEPQAFLTRQTSNGPERSNRGFTIIVARSFGGLLPIVSGVQRRGVVR